MIADWIRSHSGHGTYFVGTLQALQLCACDDPATLVLGIEGVRTVVTFVRLL